MRYGIRIKSLLMSMTVSSADQRKRQDLKRPDELVYGAWQDGCVSAARLEDLLVQYL